MSVKNLHDKVDKISDMIVQNGLEQIRTNEKVDTHEKLIVGMFT